MVAVRGESDESMDSASSSEESGAEEPRRPRRRPVSAKDADEEELERLVLGDQSGFREQLFKKDELMQEDEKSLEEKLGLGQPAQETGLEHFNDAELFFLDSIPTASDRQLAKAAVQSLSKKDDESAPAAWEDSEEERLSVSLATVSRLRKFRLAESDDVMNGTEYVRRLRREFLRIQPTPAWAKYGDDGEDGGGKPAKKRRQRSSSAAATDDGSSSDLGDTDAEDGDDLSALPLEKVLRDVRKLAGKTVSSRQPNGRHRVQLRPEVIDMQRTRDIPDQHRAAVASLCFHPTFTDVLLSASTASILYLHRVDPAAHPVPNPSLTSVEARSIPVRRAEFLGSQGSRIIFAGRRRYMHSWDLATGNVQKISNVLGHNKEHRTMERFRTSPCGRYIALGATTRKGGGVINILSVDTMQWVAAARLDSRGGIVDFAWWRDGDGLTILGKSGRVGEWSLEKRAFVGVWMDDGSVGGTVLALGGVRDGYEVDDERAGLLGGDAWVAVGSTSGITNIYRREDLLAPKTSIGVAGDADGPAPSLLKERPKPTRVFEQLRTPVTVLQFSPDGQLLAFGSVHARDALRLAHLPSCTVYRNWPTAQTPLGRITALAFSPQSDLLAVGNDSGRIRMWQIRG